MVVDNQANMVYFSDLLRTDAKYNACHDAIIGCLEKHNVKYGYLSNTRDIWARDYMPIPTASGKFIAYRYDPDYLLPKKYRHLKTYPDIVCDTIGIETVKTDIILDGGNVVKSNNSVVLTDKAIQENKKSYTVQQLETKLKELLEVENVVWIPWDKSEYMGHADGMLRFANDEEVLLNHFYDFCPKSFQQKLYGALEKRGLNINKMAIDVPNPDDKLNWAYINFLEIGDLILVPKLGIAEDDEAFEQIQKFYPNAQHEQIDCRSIVERGGALNCISWTLKQ